MIEHNIVELCRAYAELMCDARRFDRAHESPTRLAASPYALCLFNGAEALLRSAPAEAREHLDTVKKVLEIDQTITTVSVVLLRASLIGQAKVIAQATDPDTTPTSRPSTTCIKCGRTSYNLNDIQNNYCAACHDWTSKPNREASST